MSGKVIYFSYDEYLYLDYLCMYQHKLSKPISSSNNTIYDDIYGNRITYVLMDIL